MILDLLFPNRCLQCNRIIPGDEIICGLCFDQVNFTHWKFGDDNLLKQRCNLMFPTENAYALMQFEEESLSRKIVHALKYSGREKVGRILAKWTTEKLNVDREKPNLIVTVPMHPKKEKARGYNQLHLFANEISKYYGIPVDHKVLKKNYHKKAQALKDKTQRAATEKVFTLQKNIENSHVLLIDDVYTTGSTMASAAWEILKTGNNKVSVLVMAID